MTSSDIERSLQLLSAFPEPNYYVSKNYADIAPISACFYQWPWMTFWDHFSQMSLAVNNIVIIAAYILCYTALFIQTVAYLYILI